MRVQFGECVFDADARRLTRGQHEVSLSPKAFELLKLLIENRPRAIAKRELHDHVWPATFVADDSLARLVTEIRSAISDDARAPRFVRTVHGFGYAFAGTAVEKRPLGPEPTRPAASYWLIWQNRKFALAEGINLAGRSPEAAIWLDVPGVSREHARFTVEDGVATVEDLGSRNGTYQAGRQVTAPVALHDGDPVQLGPVLMTFRVWAPGSGTRTQDLNGSAAPAS